MVLEILSVSVHYLYRSSFLQRNASEIIFKVPYLTSSEKNFFGKLSICCTWTLPLGEHKATLLKVLETVPALKQRYVCKKKELTLSVIKNSNCSPFL